MIRRYDYVVRVDTMVGCWSIKYLIYLASRRAVEHKVAAVLGSDIVVSRWMVSHVRGLDYLAPCCVLTTPSGYNRIIDFLDSLEQCIYI